MLKNRLVIAVFAIVVLTNLTVLLLLTIRLFQSQTQGRYKLAFGIVTHMQWRDGQGAPFEKKACFRIDTATGQMWRYYKEEILDTNDPYNVCGLVEVREGVDAVSLLCGPLDPNTEADLFMRLMKKQLGYI